MEELLSKLSAYNILNNLLPGIMFCVIGERITDWPLVQSDAITALFVYYFIGLIINRVGSIFLEPILKLIHFVSFVPHERYLAASKKDALLPELSQTNNLLRSLIAMAVCLLLMMLSTRLATTFPWLSANFSQVGMVLLLLFLLLSYRKQTSYIVKRVRLTEKDSDSIG